MNNRSEMGIQCFNSTLYEVLYYSCVEGMVHLAIAPGAPLRDSCAAVELGRLQKGPRAVDDWCHTGANLYHSHHHCSGAGPHLSIEAAGISFSAFFLHDSSGLSPH